MASDLLKAMFGRTERTGTQDKTRSTPEVRRMLSVLAGEMTRGEIQERLGLKDEKHFRENYQQVAVKLSLIEMTIPSKPRSSRQKYRPTEKGWWEAEVNRFSLKAQECI